MTNSRDKIVRVSDADGLGERLGRASAAQFSNAVSRASGKRSFSDLLSDLYRQTDEVLAQLNSLEDPIKRVEGIKAIAKTLPLLQSAERNARTMIKRKAVEEMGDEELARLATAVLKSERKHRFPLKPGNSAVNTNPDKKIKNSDFDKKEDESDIPLFPTVEDEDGTSK
jgi:hypothetical protein